MLSLLPQVFVYFCGRMLSRISLSHKFFDLIYDTKPLPAYLTSFYCILQGKLLMYIFSAGAFEKVVLIIYREMMVKLYYKYLEKQVIVINRFLRNTCFRQICDNLQTDFLQTHIINIYLKSKL